MRTTTCLCAAAVASVAEGFMIAPQMSAAGVLAPFQAGKALKVIAGLNNFDRSLVEKVARAAQVGGASLIDIAADPELVKAAMAVSNVPVCVSAIDPELFVPCVEAGAQMVELGNFDAFYEQGLQFTAADVIAMTQRTRQLLPDIPLSVTVPHTLHMDEQVALAVKLQELGADVIQTEGKYSLNPQQGGIQGVIERAAPTLAAAYAIAREVSIPVMAASGISEVTAPMALAAGAKGVGVGSAVNKQNSDLGMLATVRAIANSMGIPAPSKVQVEQPAQAAH